MTKMNDLNETGKGIREWQTRNPEASQLAQRGIYNNHNNVNYSRLYLNNDNNYYIAQDQ